MNLPFINKFNKKVLPSYFLVLVLRDETAQAVIFEELVGKINIVGQEEEHFSDSIDNVSEKELLEVLDKGISAAESKLPPNIQTQKTIFGVKDSWTENDQIKKEFLVKLKKASEELGLIPIGFLVISQAISHLLQEEEGAPVSAILTEVNKKSVTVTLLRAGKSIETKTSEIQKSIPFTVDTILKHFNIPEILPSRIIIFNGKEDLSQEFISHTWNKSLPFLHLPQIINLPHGFDAKSVLFGAAIQMGFEVLQKDIPKEPRAQKPMELNTTDEVNDLRNISDSNFGFAKDVDVANIKPQEKQEEKIQEIEPIKEINNIEEHFSPKENIAKILSKIPRGKIGIITSAILILFIGLIISYFLFVRATVAITVEPKILTQDKNILFSTTAETNADKNIIKGEFVSVSQNGTASTTSTGKKDTGTNAKGAVAVFNSLSLNKTLSAGTILTSSNGLEFTLDSSLTIKGVASHSADENPPPEKVDVNVTANQLGKESNLPSGTKFTVESFDKAELIAKNDNPFSGGTKKEVTVVSKNDALKLEADLPKQLGDKAKEELIKQIGQNKVLLPAFISNVLTKKTMNAKIGDETSKITLTGTVEYRGISYDKNDLIKFSKSLLEKSVSSNQEIDYNNIKISVKDVGNKNDEEVQANLNINTLLLPKISEVKFRKEFKGKSFKDAEDEIYKFPQVVNVSISLSPKFPLLPKNLPNIEKNIKILIKING